MYNRRDEVSSADQFERCVFDIIGHWGMDVRQQTKAQRRQTELFRSQLRHTEGRLSGAQVR